MWILLNLLEMEAMLARATQVALDHILQMEDPQTDIRVMTLHFQQGAYNLCAYQWYALTLMYLCFYKLLLVSCYSF